MENNMRTEVEFCSDKFPQDEGEEQQINPGLWGKRLAEYLKEHLAAEGIETKEPLPEDWGWCCNVRNLSQNHKNGILFS
jgi:hypothetical protein